jgi:hypothetical protein
MFFKSEIGKWKITFKKIVLRVDIKVGLKIACSPTKHQIFLFHLKKIAINKKVLDKE